MKLVVLFLCFYSSKSVFGVKPGTGTLRTVSDRFFIQAPGYTDLADSHMSFNNRYNTRTQAVQPAKRNAPEGKEFQKVRRKKSKTIPTDYEISQENPPPTSSSSSSRKPTPFRKNANVQSLINSKPVTNRLGTIPEEKRGNQLLDMLKQYNAMQQKPKFQEIREQDMYSLDELFAMTESMVDRSNKIGKKIGASVNSVLKAVAGEKKPAIKIHEFRIPEEVTKVTRAKSKFEDEFEKDELIKAAEWFESRNKPLIESSMGPFHDFFNTKAPHPVYSVVFDEHRRIRHPGLIKSRAEYLAAHYMVDKMLVGLLENLRRGGEEIRKRLIQVTWQLDNNVNDLLRDMAIKNNELATQVSEKSPMAAAMIDDAVGHLNNKVVDSIMINEKSISTHPLRRIYSDRELNKRRNLANENLKKTLSKYFAVSDNPTPSEARSAVILQINFEKLSKSLKEIQAVSKNLKDGTESLTSVSTQILLKSTYDIISGLYELNHQLENLTNEKGKKRLKDNIATMLGNASTIYGDISLISKLACISATVAGTSKIAPIIVLGLVYTSTKNMLDNKIKRRLISNGYYNIGATTTFVDQTSKFLQRFWSA